MVRARVGDLAIIRFDPDDDDKAYGRKWNEEVGMVTGTYDSDNNPREQKFIYWCRVGNRIDVFSRSLPPGRLVRARPKHGNWEGTLFSLTRDNVEPIRRLK